MVTTQTRCPVCKSQQRETIRVGVREDLGREVYRCACGVEYIELPFDPTAYYESEYRQTHNPIPGRFITSSERAQQYAHLMDSRLERFRKYVPPGCRVLEVGCSSGYFLETLARSGYSPLGCDLNPEDVAYVWNHLQIPCEQGEIGEVFGEKKFGAVCAFAVLEHVADPAAWVEDAYNRLRDGGTLYVDVPNLNDALLSAYRIPEYAAFWYREPHLTYWTADTLRTLLEGAGFQVTIDYAQEYSLGNHLWWLFKRQGMPNAYMGQIPFIPAAELAGVFERLDAEYRGELVARGMTDRLVAVGKKG